MSNDKCMWGTNGIMLEPAASDMGIQIHAVLGGADKRVRAGCDLGVPTF